MKARTPVIVNILIILTILFIMYYMFVQNNSFFTSPYFWGTVVISIILAMIHNAIGDLIENHKFKALNEEEKDMLIDHGFDGIMELDNQLPKWWLGLFYFGVIYCIIYVVSYSFTNFADPIKEYDEEYKTQLAAIDEYMKTAPQATLENAVYSSDMVTEGEEIFKTNCVSCHMDGGKGGIGPNLTDNAWINQPESTLFKSVFHVVYNGSPNNPTMVAFGQNGQLTGNDIQKVASYIYHINQEQQPITPAQGGAAPQGTEANWEK